MGEAKAQKLRLGWNRTLQVSDCTYSRLDGHGATPRNHTNRRSTNLRHLGLFSGPLGTRMRLSRYPGEPDCQNAGARCGSGPPKYGRAPAVEAIVGMLAHSDCNGTRREKEADERAEEIPLRLMLSPSVHRPYHVANSEPSNRIASQVWNDLAALQKTLSSSPR